MTYVALSALNHANHTHYLLSGGHVFTKGVLMSAVSNPNALRKGYSLHGVSLDLRDQFSSISYVDYESLPDITTLYNSSDDEQIFDTFFQLALDGQIHEPDDFYLLVRSLLRSRKPDEAIELMNRNIELVYSSRNVIYEYIVISSKLGKYSNMNKAISHLDEIYALNGTHSKVLQALIQARVDDSRINDYIEKMDLRFKEKSSYEILRAAFNSKAWTLALEHAPKMPSSARNNFLALRTYFRTKEKEKAAQLLKSMNPALYSEPQVLEIIRIGLQYDKGFKIEQWLKHSSLNPAEIEVELARSQYKNALTDSDFNSAFAAFKTLYPSEEFTPHQVLLLIRSSNGDPEVPLSQLFDFGQKDPFLLSCIIELSTKYNFKQMAMVAFKRLEAMTLCSDRHSKLFSLYSRSAISTADLNLMSSVYNQLPSQSFRGSELLNFCNYFDELKYYLGDIEKNLMNGGNELLEVHLLSLILSEHLPNISYEPIPNHTLIVNNSLKFGGAERQVVRCLSATSFSKNLVVWNSIINTPSNSFIEEVQQLDVPILDYSLFKTPSEMIFTKEIENMLSLIPHTSPLNPGMTHKIRNLVAILREERPYSLHLWQDTTNVLGAIAGLIAGVPRIVMSARSLPPFALADSTFPDKGPNYYLNNRYVRDLYQKLLVHENVYLCHNSENGLDKYIEWLNGYDDKMLLLRNGFDFSSTSGGDVKISNHEQNFVVGTVFRFVEVKRPILWLDIAARVLDLLDHNVIFRLVGDGPMLEAAMTHARTLGIEKSVQFLGYRDDVKDILPTFDTFLLTSSIEGLPNVLIEAQSMGVPVVSTNAGGANETFLKDLTGILVDSQDSNEIAHAVCNVLQDSNFKENAQQKGREFVHSRFGIEAMHKQLKHILFEEL